MSTEYTTTGNGSQTNYSFTFPYLKESDIKATVAGVAKTQGTGSDQWQFHNATTVKFNTAPANLSEIRIYRETADTNLSATFYAGSAIKSQDLNDNFTQNLYVTQEVREEAEKALNNSRSHDGDGTYTTAISKADSAVTTAGNADTKADTAKLATDRLVATTSNSGSTWTLAGNNTNASTDPKGVGYAVTTSETAKTAVDTYVHDGTNLKGDGIGGNPQGVKYAVDTATTASSNASDALSNSRESNGSGGYNSAISIANDAKTNADTSKLASDRLVATTSDGGSTWTLTGNNTNASTDPKGVGYAVTTAEAAKNTADTSAATVANSAIYQVVANYAALPALSSVDDGKFYQVNDSTNIENSFSDITGEPSNFVGHSGLTVKLKSNTTASPKVWEWQEYYANDPETRYRKKLIVENKMTIDENYTIGTNNNAFSVGPVAIAATKILTIPANSLYLIH